MKLKICAQLLKLKESFSGTGLIYRPFSDIVTHGAQIGIREGTWIVTDNTAEMNVYKIYPFMILLISAH